MAGASVSAQISMLHFETLYLLRSLAARTKDAIVEVGPYIGGSTIALGRGIQIGGGGPLISVEMGGSYPSHAVPTNDIIADLKSNIETLWADWGRAHHGGLHDRPAHRRRGRSNPCWQEL